MAEHLHIHCLQHISFETPGFISEWASLHGHCITFTKLYEPNYTFPDPDSFDWLLIMGGAMGCYEEDLYPFLTEEKQFIRTCITVGKVVLGICLGAQLLAECLGAKVYPGTYREIGFLPVQFTSAAVSHPLLQGIPPVMELFQWHGDTFDLPEGATLLASSEACINQAYLTGKCLGMQFHWEADESIIKDMLQADRHELKEQGPFVHREEKILADIPKVEQTKLHLFGLLDRLAVI